MPNPLLDFTDLPPFSDIKPEHVKPAVEKAIADCRHKIDQVLEGNENPTWDNICLPIDETDSALSRLWSPVSHLNSVANSEELREAYESCLPLLSEFSTWVGQHKGLYEAYKTIKSSGEFERLSQAKQKSITDALRDFELSGIGLPADEQHRYGEISKRLSELASKFSNNVLDATMGWSKHITDAAELSGMPESALEAAKAAAEAKELNGYLLTLEMPSYIPVLTYCDNQELRREMYEAYNTRASDRGPNAGQWDNTEIMLNSLSFAMRLHVCWASLTTASAPLPLRWQSLPSKYLAS